MEWIGLFLLAFFLRGASRVHSDFSAPPVDQPPYARSGNLAHVPLVMMFWWRRQPSANLAVNFLWSFAFMWLLFWLLGFAIKSVSIRFAVLLLIPVIILVTGLDLRRRKR